MRARASAAQFLVPLVAGLLGAWANAPAAAQQTVVTTPNVGLSDGFFENFGVGFGFNLRGGGNVIGLQPNGQPTPNGAIQFRWGGAAEALPPFGGFNPNGDARLGFAVRGNNADLFFNLAASQGSSRNISSVAPSVTVPNGGTGGVFDTLQRPFVTGLVPVVGEWNHLPAFPAGTGTYVSPLAERISRVGGIRVPAEPVSVAVTELDVLPAAAESSAARGDVSVAEIRAQLAADDAAAQRALADLIAEAETAEAEQKWGAASYRYAAAARRAQGAMRERLLKKCRELESRTR